MQKTFLLLSCLLLLSSLALAQRIRCDPDNRPNRDDCYQEPNVNSCAYYEEDCPREICGKNAYNGCDACSDPNVLYYREGECAARDLVLTCLEGMCNADFDPQQFTAYEPVCGLRRGRGNRLVVETFDNACELCENSNYRYYQPGTCRIDREYCDDSDREKDQEDLDQSDDPVCASFTTNDFGRVYTTAFNGDQACLDPAVDFWTEGACGPLRDNVTYCLPNNRPVACTLDYTPVCGFYKDENGQLEHKVMGNACSACGDPEILYHTPGECVFYCDLNPNVIYDCAGVLEPVCGTYIENGGERTVSLRNGCIGCYYSGKKILTYTDGLCPGDEGIRCENDAGAFAEGFLNPVCGLTREICNRDSCRETYAEPILACSDPNVIWYSLEACPGDGGVSCEDYRTRPSEPLRVYDNVCGYTELGCTSDSCRDDYDDQYDACEDSDVLFFTKGPC